MYTWYDVDIEAIIEGKKPRALREHRPSRRQLITLIAQVHDLER